MLIGHYSAAFLVKTAEPRLPLWVLAIAVQFIDVLWAVFVLVGLEHLRVDPNLPSNPLDLYDMPYTHSLVGALGWAALAAAAVLAWRKERLVALAAGAAVATHWLLDWFVHRPDLLLWSGSAKQGLSLWNYPLVSLLLELLLLVASAALWVRMGRVAEGKRRRVVVFVSVLVATQIVLSVAPPPVGPTAVAGLALVLFAAVAWGAWRVEHGAVRA